jgi:hypothetical protein
MAGYTHMQQAQPVTLGHYMLSLFFALERDRERFLQARSRAGLCPLGSGALAGSAFPVDRRAVAAELGFEGITDNSIDAVSHRDWTLEYLSACAILGTTLSRYAEDFVTWSSSEFGYVTFSDRYTTGSSMMPNKKNPDGFELARGKTGRLVGNLATLLVAVKGAPLTYSRDLQEDKEPVFDSSRTVEVLLGIFRGALSEAVWHPDRMRSRLTDLLLATDLADLLVETGIGLPRRPPPRGRPGGRGRARRNRTFGSSRLRLDRRCREDDLPARETDVRTEPGAPRHRRGNGPDLRGAPARDRIRAPGSGHRDPGGDGQGGILMDWFHNSKSGIETAVKRDTPSDLWMKCENCKEVVYKSDWTDNLAVCPACGHHHRFGAREYIQLLLDPQTFREEDATVAPADPLKFTAKKRYKDSVAAAQKSTGRAIRGGFGDRRDGRASRCRSRSWTSASWADPWGRRKGRRSPAPCSADWTAGFRPSWFPPPAAPACTRGRSRCCR